MLIPVSSQSVSTSGASAYASVRRTHELVSASAITTSDIKNGPMPARRSQKAVASFD